MPVADYAAVFDLAPVPLVLLTGDHVVVHANREWLADAMTTLDDAAGRRLFDILPAASGAADVRHGLRTSLGRARASRQPSRVLVQRRDIRVPGGGSTSRTWSFRTVPILRADGEVALLVHYAEEITRYVLAPEGDRASEDRRRSAERLRHVEAALHARTRDLERAHAQLRAVRKRERRSVRSLAGLATTVSALAGAENRDDLLRHLFRHGRATLEADALAVALLDVGGGRLTVVDTTGPADALPTRPLPLDSPLPIASAASGQPAYQPDAERGGASPPPLPGLRAWAALPLRAGRRPLGSITVGWKRPHPLEEDDIGLFEAFAAQCAQAIERVARLQSERRNAAATRSLAEVLQRSLLTEPPQPEHLDIAVRYRPAAREAQIGGDWYDAFLSSTGTVTVAVGDVTGYDRTAAAAAGQMRNLLRGIACALEGCDPARVLGTLDRALHTTGVTPLATAVVASVDNVPAESDSAPTFRWSNAGHPPPLLIEPDGGARLLQPPTDLLLGVVAEAVRTHHAVPLRPGATVVLYTDGLIERHDATLDDGLARLLAAAPGLAGLPVNDLCDELFARLHPELTDDIAVLALRARVR